MNRLVYIAGPYSTPDPCENTFNACATATALWGGNLLPVVPHLTHFWHTMAPRPYTDWLDLDLEILRRCDAVFRMQGESPGADDEVAEARRLDIPVFTSLHELRSWATR